MATRERFSVAMTDAVHLSLVNHLRRADGQEDVCLATYASSAGLHRDTALIREAFLPQDAEREVHGNVTFSGRYVLRVAREASGRGLGLVLLHSHPGGLGWQPLSVHDADAESSYAYLVEKTTGLPLVGMTLAESDEAWSARRWTPDRALTEAENVRVLGAQLRVTWNDSLAPTPATMPSQLRTVSAWGEATHADIARLRVLVVGVGSVGMDVAVRLAATGIQTVGVMDFDVIEEVNRDRLVFATRRDARLRRPKVKVAARACISASTAAGFKVVEHPIRLTEPNGQTSALDYDLIFSCVDRPWPRAVLNQLAYTDLIPVIDGGIAIDTFSAGEMRNATCRAHIARPGRPCMQCNGQLDPAEVSTDRQGLLDDPKYIKMAGLAAPGKQNVAILSTYVVASQLALFVSLLAAPSGIGEPGPLRFSLSTHRLEHVAGSSNPSCIYENMVAFGDQRVPLVKLAATVAGPTLPIWRRMLRRSWPAAHHDATVGNLTVSVLQE